MSLINNSALSCIATAVGCTLTGIAVSEHLDQPNPTGPIKLGAQQNPLMNAEDLMAAASNGVEKSVAPPTQMFAQELTPSVEANNFSSFAPTQPEIWQQSPLDISNLVATAPSRTQTQQPNVKPMGNFSDDFFPDYLNFDADSQPPEPIEVAMEDFPEPEIISQPISVSELPLGLEPIPAPPPLGESEDVLAQYIVEPEAIVRNNSQRTYADNRISPQQLDSRSASQYIVEPQKLTRVAQQQRQRKNSPGSRSQFSTVNSAQLASQYVVEPQSVMVDVPSPQPQEIASTFVEVNNPPARTPRVSRTSTSNFPPTRSSTINSTASATNPRPQLLQKLVEPYQLPSEEMENEDVSPMSSTPETNQLNLGKEANSVKEETEFIVAVESEFEAASEPMIEEVEDDTEYMPSLLRNLVESYNDSSDVLHDIKVSPSPLEPSESKFARN